MSKLIYIRARSELTHRTVGTLGRISARLMPDHLAAWPSIVHHNGLIAYAVMSPSNAMHTSADSILLGCMFGSTVAWSVPGAETPDGSYALVRSDEAVVEAVSDPAGSRTIWTFVDDELFVCATSQRAILMVVGGLDFDERVVPWMLSTGTLGPEHSWDRRIQRLPPDSTLTLSCRDWRTTLKAHRIRFAVREQSTRQHRNDVMSAIEETFGAEWSCKPDTLVVPLSGGYDSRTIACLLQRSRRNPAELQTITWGLDATRTMPGTDAHVARDVAAALGVSNQFIALDDSTVDPQVVLGRFVRQSEGRVDHLAGYVDGMNLWRRLHEAGVRLIVRGDEGFGWVPAATERAVRYAVGLALASDYANLKMLLEHVGIASNELPAIYQRESGESLPSWRDRLYHAYRIPVLLAALSDLKLGYLELINPLLSRRILQTVRTLPDDLRTEKKLFKEVVDSVGVAIPYATASAIDSQGSVVASETYCRVVTEALLDTAGPRSPLPAGLLTAIASGMRVRSPGASHSRAARGRRLASLVPSVLRDRVRDLKAKDIAYSTLGFRAYLVCATLKLMAEDRDHIRNPPR